MMGEPHSFYIDYQSDDSLWQCTGYDEQGNELGTAWGPSAAVALDEWIKLYNEQNDYDDGDNSNGDG